MGTEYVQPSFYLPQHHHNHHPHFQFPSTSTDFGSGHRPLRSWHGSPNSSPPLRPAFLPVMPTASTSPVASPVYQRTLQHPDYSLSRRRSIDVPLAVQPVATGVTPWPTVPSRYFAYPSGWVPPMELPRPELHNLINGDIATTHLHLNFLDEDLVFKKRTRSIIHCLSTVSSYDLEQPATHPQMTHVRIVCDMIPQWPVDLQVLGTSLYPHRRGRAPLRYLTVEDVVHAVHASLHHKVSHREWGRLDRSQQSDVAREYTRRYRSARGEWSECQEQAEGVKRVDFLFQTSWFKGFTWLEPENGVERLGLVVGLESF